MEGTYASAFQIFSNIYDIKIEFSSVDPQVNEKGDVTGDARMLKGRITMSPALAKELAQVLTGVVADYEEKFGHIPDVNKNTSK